MHSDVQFKSLCKIDSTGRVVIPAVLRKMFDIKTNDQLTITATNTGILFTKPAKTVPLPCHSERSEES